MYFWLCKYQSQLSSPVLIINKFLVLCLFYSLICDLSIKKECVFFDLLLYLFCLTLCVFWYGLHFTKHVQKIVSSVNMFLIWILIFTFNRFMLRFWSNRTKQGSYVFGCLKALKIAFILCILDLIVVFLGFYLDFWGLGLWDLMICGLLVGIFDDMWFWVLVEIIWFLSEWW